MAKPLKPGDRVLSSDKSVITILKTYVDGNGDQGVYFEINGNKTGQTSLASIEYLLYKGTWRTLNKEELHLVELLYGR